jgi:hypothetical protein
MIYSFLKTALVLFFAKVKALRSFGRICGCKITQQLPQVVQSIFDE